MIDENNILETINMIRLYNLDIRTVTLALSLRDCVSEDIDKVCDNIYNKIKKYAKNLVAYADELADEYSIPIINKRIAVTPISLIGEACKEPDYVRIAQVVDKAAKEVVVEKAFGGDMISSIMRDAKLIFDNSGNLSSGEYITREGIRISLKFSALKELPRLQEQFFSGSDFSGKDWIVTEAD